MTRNPSNFFTKERREVLEDLVGKLSDQELSFLYLVGERATKELWPMERYRAINDPSNNHEGLRRAIQQFIDPNDVGLRGCFLPPEAFIFMPEEYRIGGISFPVYMMGLEMIAQGNGSVALSLLIDGSVLNSIWRLGEDAQKQRYVIDALRNKQMTSFALTEPSAGSDGGRIKTRADVREDHYLINGQKNWITNGGFADFYFVVVRTNSDQSLGPKGLSVIILHKDEIPNKDEIAKYTVEGSSTAILYLDNVRVPFESDGVKRMIGERDKGFTAAKDLLVGGRVTMAAFGDGISAEALEMAWNYARARPSNGGYLIDHQGNSFPLAELDTRLDAARYLTYRAAKRMQEEKLSSGVASKAKLFANDLANDATLFNLNIHGASGLAKDYRCMQLFHDARVGVTGEGPAEIQKVLIVSDRKKTGFQ